MYIMAVHSLKLVVFAELSLTLGVITCGVGQSPPPMPLESGLRRESQFLFFSFSLFVILSFSFSCFFLSSFCFVNYRSI